MCPEVRPSTAATPEASCAAPCTAALSASILRLAAPSAPRWLRASARICTPEELVFTAPGGRFDSLRFLQLWTAKEAWVKYTGEGLGVDFRTLPAAAADGMHETLFGRRLEQTVTEDYVLSVVYDAV